ncbi:MAG: T9SS type A sorting domain-containing protein, partial [Saprospiraceae bacterium]
HGTGQVGGVVPAPAITDANGRYEITVDANTSYRIRPMNNQDITEGVTAFDNVIISRHILGLQLFDSPYQTIAADANKSGTITAFDIVLIRKIVLAKDNFFENNTSWRFIDADFQFTDILSAAAAPFMESFEVTADMGNVKDMDFVAVKIGDVNDTNSANGGLVTTPTSRNNRSSISFELPNQKIEKGKIYEVPFQLKNGEKVASYQFTLDFEGLTLLDIQPGIATPAHFETKLAKRGLLTTCWSTPHPTLSTGTWFTLRFKARKNGRLSELLTVTSEITPIEAYTTDAENIGVKLTFKEPVTTSFDLFQNKPNPFKNQTTIGFALPQAAPAKITVLDMQGKIIYSTTGNYDSGYNEIVIQQSQLPKGVFYYRLETAFGTKTQKMMHLE